MTIVETMMPYVLVIGAIFCAFFGGAPLLQGLREHRRLAAKGASSKPENLSVRHDQSVVERLLGKRDLGPANEKERSSLKLALVQAGFESPYALQTFYGMRMVLALALSVVGLLVLPVAFHNINQMTVLALVGMLGIAGYLAPPLVLSHKRSVNQQRLREALPDILDLLVVCTEAGLGLDMAITRVADETAATHPLIAKHLRTVTRELQAGRTRADALRGFSLRTGIEEINSLIQLLIQSDALGTSMAQALRTFAIDMRAYRLTRVEEMANKAVVKMSMVLVGLLMPALMTAIMSPVVRKAVVTFGNLDLGQGNINLGQ
jgi:tight adherence protein C